MSSASGYLTRAAFWLKKVGAPTGNITAKLYAHTGTYGVSSLPGTLLATSNSVDVSTLPTSVGRVDFYFSGTYSLAAGTPYIVTVHCPGAAGPDHYELAYKPVPPGSHSGCEVENQDGLGGWLTDTDEDNLFQVEVAHSERLRITGVRHYA